MPRQSQSIAVSGPWGGLNERVDPRQIDNREVESATNMVLRDGRRAPRPGYAKARTDGLIWAATLVGKTGAAANVRGVAVSADTVSSVGAKIVYYGTAADTIGNVSYDGTTVAMADLYTAADGVSAPVDVAHDAVNNRLYFTKDADTIQYAPDSGAGPVTTLESGLTGANAVVVDPAGGKVYYADNTNVYSESLTGGSKTTVLSGVNARHLALDVANGKIYWGDTSKVVKRANLNGTSIETVWTYGGGGVTFMGLDVASDKSHLVVSVSGDGINLVDFSSGVPVTYSSDQRVYRVTGNIDHVAYDAEHGMVVWSEDKTLYRSRAFLTTEYTIVPAFWWRRSLLGVDASAGDFSKDIVLLQGINTTQSVQDLLVWEPTDDATHFLDMGYAASSGGTDPHRWVTNNRRSDPSIGDSLAVTSGRMAAAYLGSGINTGRGGVILADGDADSDSPWVFNYLMGDTIQTITVTGHSSGNLVLTNPVNTDETFTASRTTTEQLWYNRITTAGVTASWTSFDQAVVTKSAHPADNYVITVRFIGSWSGKSVPAMIVDDSGIPGSAVVATTQVGGTDTDRWLYLRPAGLPTPQVTETTTGGTDPGFYAQIEAAPSAAILTGVYSYKVTFYSSRWGIESPPSEHFGAAGTAAWPYVAVDSTTPNRANIMWEQIPSTLWFRDTTGSPSVPFMHVDKVRIYRRRWGDTLSGGVPDGVGAWDTWRFIAEVDLSRAVSEGRITAANPGFYSDSAVTDAAASVGTPVPHENQYPPKNANYVTIHKDRAWYASMTPGDHNLWHSERPKRGGISDGELGHEYVANTSFETVGQFIPSDAPFTGLYGDFGDTLLVGTPGKLLRVTAAEDFFGGELFNVNVLRGSRGLASHWLIAESDEAENRPGFLFLMSPDGHVYAFDGAGVTLVSGKLRATPDGLHRKYWHDVGVFDPGLNDSLYWGSMVLDPLRDVLIVSVFDRSDSAGRNLVLPLSVDSGSGLRPGWDSWDIGGHGWIIGREWTGGDKGTPLVVFGLADRVYKLADGKADDGTAFTWNMATRRFTTMPLRETLWRQVTLGYRRRSFGGSDAAVAIQPRSEGINLTASGTITLTADAALSADQPVVSYGITGGARLRDMQFILSGTQADDQSHPELLDMEIALTAPVGASREVKPG